MQTSISEIIRSGTGITI